MRWPLSMPSRMGSTWPELTVTRIDTVSVPRLTPSYVPAVTLAPSSSRWPGAAGNCPETAPNGAHPAVPWRRTGVVAMVPAVRPAAATTTVPTCGRSTGRSWMKAKAATASAAAPSQRTRALRLRSLQGSPAVTRRDLVDVSDALIRDRRALDLEHVLGVVLSAVREIEAAHVHVVVRDQDLGVHEIVHSPLSVRRRALRPERRGGHYGVEGVDLPRGGGLSAPLALHLIHLGRVVDTGDIDVASLADLGQRAEDGA